MPLNFYYGSGSPFAWRVWLALEHKAIPYEFKLISFSAGDTKKPEFLALNPRHQVPVISDGDFSLYESAVILEYLEEQYPSTNPARALLPKYTRQRALARRLASEVDTYLTPAVSKLSLQYWFTPEAERNAKHIAGGRETFAKEMEFFEQALRGDWLIGPLSLADFTLYPSIAQLVRMEAKQDPSLNVAAMLGPKLTAWRKRFEALPYFEKCTPPHWKA